MKKIIILALLPYMLFAGLGLGFKRGDTQSGGLHSIAGLTETNGGLLYGTADNTYAWLAAGTSLYVLQGNGAGAPSWSAVTGTGSVVRTTSPNLLTYASILNSSAGATADTSEFWNIKNNAVASSGNQKAAGLTLSGNGWKTDATAASMRVQWTIENLPVQGAAAPASLLNFKSSINKAAYTTPMNLTSTGALTCLAYGKFGTTIIGNSTDMLYGGSSTTTGALTYSANAWFLDNTSFTITKVAPDDQDTYGFYINYDADSDASANTASQIAFVPKGNATPANSTAHLSQTVGNGYTIDKSVNVFTDSSTVDDDYGFVYAPITAYATGMRITLLIGVANDGACTLQINALGAKNIKALHDQDPAATYFEVGGYYDFIYDGTNFQCLTPDSNP